MTRAALAAMVCAALAGCGRRYSVPSVAMMPTLRMGDDFSTRPLEDGEPVRGDVVVFAYRTPVPGTPMLEVEAGRPDAMDGEDFVKRVVALAGDRVRLEGDVLMLNGQPIATEPQAPSTCDRFFRDYDPRPTGTCGCVVQRESIGGRQWTTQHNTDPTCAPMRQADWPLAEAPHRPYLGAKAYNPTWPDVVVPAGHVLVMGDNRDGSQDSRSFGFVPVERIKAKAVSVVSNRFDPDRGDLPLD